ncbi:MULTISPECIES: SUMF1/EgtB/PvdO family nonheme iron enzyme [Pseudomonas]|uniref:formylglycine-generating enzyme family protein n=1 Tax=Pseudomonas TaxID=286 RepID=UPI000D005506|nr:MULTISPECIES: SUMF1/EgtB/PvdO family nonheme iron enzyme [Pseudomonas]PRA47289.1 hypothetical protein CQZ98_22515 [Pseudomonas sp. MYb115]QXN47949.1 formylglycine-generating enzyme family protein [Pseudomonas fluorescens]WSO22257.1 SUMF1/EgtB/PvdO family nonheme iron enzyme [Pseudomonas fluorescens]
MGISLTRVIASIVCFLLLVGCEGASETKGSLARNESNQALMQYIDDLKIDLVFVEGGDFLMGDFGADYGPENLPYDADKDSKPLHKVRLDNYSIQKIKVTNQAYQFYLKFNGLKLRVVDAGNQKDWSDMNSAPRTPAHMDWFEAERYCGWLAVVSGLPFALPTEAQWEYAARSRGRFLMVSTDDGTYRVAHERVQGEYGLRGLNISSTWNRRAFADEMNWATEGLTPLPVDYFQPNSLGLYSMSDNGLEWVSDWYDEDYYNYSPVNNPQGPSVAVTKDYFGRGTKVVRGQAFADPAWGGGVNVYRTSAEPHGYINEDDFVVLGDKTVRCVVNSSVPVN